MNFKTTIVLFVLLIVGGAAVFFTQSRDKAASEKSVESQQKVLADLQPNDVNKLVITPADGAKMSLAKTGAAWRMSGPVNAPAESFEVDSLVRAFTGLESTNIVSGASATGLEKPRYTIDMTASGKDYTLLVGDKTAVGDSLYVSLKGKNDTFLVPADLLEKLSKPASTYRDPKLVDLPIANIGQVTIAKSDGSKIVLVKTGNDWKVTEPQQMPAEKSDVDDILFGLTGLRATEWVAEDTKEASTYQLEPARFTATLAPAGPTTLPAGIAAATSAPTSPTSQPAPVVIRLGRYDDIKKQNVFATSSQNPVIAKVGATVLAQDKKPLDLRDRKVVDIDASQVASITIASDLAATTKPTSRPASKTNVTIKRRHESIVLGPSMPATKPATTSATTLASSRPTSAPSTQAATQPVTKWEVASAADMKPADDAKVDALLSQLHPLRATKYLESAPTTQPTASYIVTIITQAAGGEPAKTHEIKVVDPGNSKPLIATYNGLAFEADRMIADRLSGDFLKGSKPSAPAGGLGNEATGDSHGEAPGPTFAP